MNNYPTYKLGDVAEIILGQSPESKSYNTQGEGLPFFQGKTEFTDWFPIPNKWCTEPKKIAEPFDVLLSVRAPVGPTNIAKEKCCIGRGLAAIRYADCYKYILYYLRSVSKYLESKATGTTFSSISGDTIKNLPIPLPPLATQHAIVTRIETLFAELDKAVQHLRTAQQQLKTYRQAVLNHWLNNDDGKWEMVKLGKVIEKPTYGTSKKCDYDIVGTGVLRIPNIGNGYIIDDDLKFAVFSDEEKEKYSLKEGDLLTIRSNGSVDLVGKCALISSKEEKYLFAGYLIRLRPFPEKVNSKFLSLTLESHKLRIQIEDKAKSTSGVNNINSVEIQNLEIPLPPLTEQQRIVNEIESRLSQATATETYIENALQQAEALRQSILKKAFSGELV